MLTSVLTTVTNFIVHVITLFGYPGVGLLMAIQSAAVPLPSEVIMPFAGYGVYLGKLNLFFVALAGGLGSCLGASLMYFLGLRGGRLLAEKYGRYVLISPADLDVTDKFFVRFGLLATFIGQLLPVVRTYISIPAGVSKVPFGKFLIFTFLGSFLWSLLLAYIGLKLGENWGSLRDRFHNFDLAVVFVIIAGAVFWVYRHLRQKSRQE